MLAKVTSEGRGQRFKGNQIAGLRMQIVKRM